MKFTFIYAKYRCIFCYFLVFAMISAANRANLPRVRLCRAFRARTGANRARHRTPRRRRDDSHRALRRHRREESARTFGPAAHEALHREPQSVLVTHLPRADVGRRRRRRDLRHRGDEAETGAGALPAVPPTCGTAPVAHILEVRATRCSRRRHGRAAARDQCGDAPATPGSVLGPGVPALRRLRGASSSLGSRRRRGRRWPGRRT